MKFFSLALLIGFSTVSFAGGENSGSVMQIKEPGYKKARHYAGEKSVAESKKKTRTEDLRSKLLEANGTSTRF